ncbi:hypothetical protein [Paenibacillus cremeus]|uniref:hypothetical protein n=1 Tax=Paenibacillus cremeus TaxID=2163881 RepID=UPI001648AA29|nr:hypothetical protein [Paenibacillus cremeus]
MSEDNREIEHKIWDSIKLSAEEALEEMKDPNGYIVAMLTKKHPISWMQDI